MITEESIKMPAEFKKTKIISITRREKHGILQYKVEIDRYDFQEAYFFTLIKGKTREEEMEKIVKQIKLLLAK